jgi:hypothetical protein
VPLLIDFEKERTGHCGDFFLSLLVDHIMTKYIIVIQRYHLHRQLLKEIIKIGQCIQKLHASQKHYSHSSKWEVLDALGLSMTYSHEKMSFFNDAFKKVYF